MTTIAVLSEHYKLFSVHHSPVIFHFLPPLSWTFSYSLLKQWYLNVCILFSHSMKITDSWSKWPFCYNGIFCWETLLLGIHVDVTLLRTTHLNTVANQHPLLQKQWLSHKVPHQTTKTARKQLNSSILCFLSLSSNSSNLSLITEVSQCNPHDLKDQMSQFQKCCETQRIFFIHAPAQDVVGTTEYTCTV